MRETSTSDIERINVIILAVGSIASAIIMRDFTHFFSFAVASAIMTLNFRLLTKVIEGVFARTVVSRKELLIKLPLKFFGLIAAVVIILLWGNVSIPFFVMGLSTVFLSILISQVVIAFSPEVRRKEDGT
jgi:hypothetical protein